MASSSDLHERCRETSRGVNVELHFTFGRNDLRLRPLRGFIFSTLTHRTDATRVYEYGYSPKNQMEMEC